jgi:hypothetical protein
MTDLDAILADLPVTPPTLAGKPTERKHRHHWVTVYGLSEAGERTGPFTACENCETFRDEARSRRGKQSRNYGNRAELSAARKYGGEKIGHAGGPVDIRGTDFNTQVKTHRRLPPLEWRKAFSAMEGKGERYPRLLLRFVQGPGLPPVDYMVIPGDVWLDWFGKDGTDDYTTGTAWKPATEDREVFLEDRKAGVKLVRVPQPATDEEAE